MAEAAAIPQHHQFARLIRLAAAAVCACIILILLAWEVPRLLDWGRYRGAIAAFAAAELGRPVNIGGPISVMLLPEPLVVAEDVELGNGGDGIALSAPSLRLKLRLIPLLVGRVVPRELVLSGAVITLPWPLPHPSGGQRVGWLGAARARVEHGELHLGALSLTDFDSDLASDPADPGGLAVSGSGRWLDRVWQLDGHLGRPDPDGAVPLQLGAELQHDPATAPVARLHFAGAIGADHGLAGRISLQIADFSKFAAAPAMPLAIDGRVNSVTARSKRSWW